MSARRSIAAEGRSGSVAASTALASASSRTKVASSSAHATWSISRATVATRSTRAGAMSGPRLRAGTQRADLQQADVVEMGNRAAAGADLDQLQGRDAHRQAAALDEAALARDLEAVGDRGLAVVDDAELGGGAAHVEGQHM